MGNNCTCGSEQFSGVHREECPCYCWEHEGGGKESVTKLPAGEHYHLVNEVDMAVLPWHEYEAMQDRERHLYAICEQRAKEYDHLQAELEQRTKDLTGAEENYNHAIERMTKAEQELERVKAERDTIQEEAPPTPALPEEIENWIVAHHPDLPMLTTDARLDIQAARDKQRDFARLILKYARER